MTHLRSMMERREGFCTLNVRFPSLFLEVHKFFCAGYLVHVDYTNTSRVFTLIETYAYLL